MSFTYLDTEIRAAMDIRLFKYPHIKTFVSGWQNDIRIRPCDTAHVQFASEIERMSTGKHTGPVWEFFKLMKVAINEKKFKAAICKLCEGVSLAYGGGTSNLLNHLEAKHPVAYKKAVPGET